MLGSLSINFKTFRVTIQLYPKNSERVWWMQKSTKIEFSFCVQTDGHCTVKIVALYVMPNITCLSPSRPPRPPLDFPLEVHPLNSPFIK
jgi:hypothetical protein